MSRVSAELLNRAVVHGTQIWEEVRPL